MIKLIGILFKESKIFFFIKIEQKKIKSSSFTPPHLSTCIDFTSIITFCIGK